MRPQVWRRCPGIWTAQETDVWFKCFQTHAEAIAYADKVSRTTTVTLPPNRLKTVAGHIEIWSTGDGAIINRASDKLRHIRIPSIDLEDVACALLSAANHQRKVNAK